MSPVYFVNFYLSVTIFEVIILYSYFVQVSLAGGRRPVLA